MLLKNHMGKYAATVVLTAKFSMLFNLVLFCSFFLSFGISKKIAKEFISNFECVVHHNSFKHFKFFFYLVSRAISLQVDDVVHILLREELICIISGINDQVNEVWTPAANPLYPFCVLYNDYSCRSRRFKSKKRKQLKTGCVCNKRRRDSVPTVLE